MSIVFPLMALLLDRQVRNSQSPTQRNWSHCQRRSRRGKRETDLTNAQHPAAFVNPKGMYLAPHAAAAVVAGARLRLQPRLQWPFFRSLGDPGVCVGSTQRLHSCQTCRTQTSGLWHAATAHSASDFASFLVLLLTWLSLLSKNENQYRSLLQSLEPTLHFALPNAPDGRESAFPRRRFRLMLSRKIQTQRAAARGVRSKAHGGNGSNQLQRKQIPRKQTENRATRNNPTPKKRPRTKEPNKSSQTAFLQLRYSSKHNRRNPKHNKIALQTRRTSPGTRERGEHPFTHSLILPHSQLLRRSRVHKCLKQARMSSLASKQTFSPTPTPATTTDTLPQSQTMQR